MPRKWVGMRRVLVEVVGILPMVFSNKCKPYCVVVRENIGSQIREYPDDLLKEYSRVVEYYQRLMRDFGNYIEVKVVNPMSLRGLRLNLKFRSRERIYFVINNRVSVGLNEDYSKLKNAIESEFHRINALANE